MASPDSQTVEASGDRSIAIGGDAINSLLVTGGVNTFFVGRYERLVDAYISPRGLYRELQLDDFTGRQWLAAEFDDFLADHDRGYVIVESGAGMGKSTFLAWLARARGYAHHFVRLMSDPNDASVAIRNLASQIIRAWDLDTHAVGGVLPPSAGRPDFLQDLLADAAWRRDELRPGEPVVLVVDGLNETVPPLGQNPLGLPAWLPEGVYVLASQRPVQVPLTLEVPRIMITIDPRGEHNMQDARAYLDNVVRRSPIFERLEPAGISADAFVATLLAKSGGVWIYLHYVIGEIARGSRSPDDLDDLPAGLWRYYARFWHDWQREHSDRWYKLDQPVLCVLAAAGEPLTAPALADLAGAGSAGLVEALIEEWRPFVALHDTPGGRAFLPFHASLGEFLRGEGDRDELSTAERSFAGRLGRATAAAHASIADRYLDGWGTLGAGLPLLREDDAVDRDGGYGLRHVVEHLISADRLEDLHALMTTSWEDGARRVNAWFWVRRLSGDIGAYRRDVEAASRSFLSSDLPQRHTRQLQYALMLSSLSSLAASAPPRLWSILVAQGQLAPQEALAIARQIPTPEERAEALTELLVVVPETLRVDVEREALAAVRATLDGYWRVGELWRIRDRVSPEMRDELLAIARSLHGFDRLVGYRVLGVPAGDDPRAAGDSPDGPHPGAAERLATSLEFLECYVRRGDFAASLLQRAGLGAGGEAEVTVGDPVARRWRAHIDLLALPRASDGDARELARTTLRLAESIADRRAAAVAWAATATAAAASVPAANALSALVEQRAGQLERAVVALHMAATMTALDAESAEDAAIHAQQAIGWAAEDELWLPVMIDSAVALARLGVARTVACANYATSPRARAEVLLATADVAHPQDAQRLCAGLLAEFATHPDLDSAGELLTRASVHLPLCSISAALELAGNLDDVETRSAARAAVAARCCELDALEDAIRVRDTETGFWREWLTYMLARAHARRGEFTRAVAMARELAPTAWRVEILAAGTHHVDGEAARAVIGEVATAASSLEPAARAAVLSRAAIAAAPEPAPRLCSAALGSARTIDDPGVRATALAAVSEALSRRGDHAGAVRAAADIPSDVVRAEALVGTLVRAREAADQILAALVEKVSEQAATLRDAAARNRVRIAVLDALRSTLGDEQGQTPSHGMRAAASAGTFDAALREFADRPRSELLESMPVLLPIVVDLDGPQNAASVASALADVIAWWP